MRCFKFLVIFVFIFCISMNSVPALSGQYKTFLDVGYDSNYSRMILDIQTFVEKAFLNSTGKEISDDAAKELANRMGPEIGNVIVGDGDDMNFVKIQIEAIVRYHTIKFIVDNMKNN